MNIQREAGVTVGHEGVSSLGFRRHVEIAAYSVHKGQKRKGGRSDKARKSPNVM